MKAAITNSLMFNLSWLGIVYSQSDLIAAGIAITHVAIHLRIMGEGRSEWLLLGGVFVFGLLLDQVLFLGGVLNIAGEPGFAPLWLSCLWLVLATTLMHAFSVLQQRLWLAAPIGVIGGCASYIAGTRLSDIGFGSPLLSLVVIGFLWFFLLPLLLAAARSLQETAAIDVC